MTVALYITFFCIVSLTICVIGTTIYHRRKISSMVGMMIAMTLGMTVGLTTGVILGILLSGNLFYSTVLGITIGIVVGFLAGLPISMIALLDGSLSGMMGGMMGAMLGEMIMPEYQESAVRLMFLLFVAFTLILLTVMKEEFFNKNKPFMHNKVVVLCFFVVFIVGYNQMNPLIPPQNHTNQLNMVMNTSNLVIQANEFSFTPNKVETPVGESVTIVLKNNGKTEHTLELERMNTGVHHDKQKEKQIHSMPGKEEQVLFTPTKSGIYYYSCTIPGHAELGMKGVIKVTSPIIKADQLKIN
ncbi:plastocyanin/azurin family copper-binding protein [Virgibacillus sp. DJP39]|uniref:plastocyanin/azurin family copper-binding protein n=1 Tax=Virgibacillus sp. DJP39 TaxID=3409790 RepID=UPI003BB7F7EC